MQSVATKVLAEAQGQLGPYKIGKSGLYPKNLDVVDRKGLEKRVRQSVMDIRKKYPTP